MIDTIGIAKLINLVNALDKAAKIADSGPSTVLGSVAIEVDILISTWLLQGC